MPIHEEVLVRLNTASAQTAATQLVTQMAAAGARAGAAYSHGMHGAMDMSMATAAVEKFSSAVDTFAAALPGRMRAHGASAGEGFSTAFGAQLSRNLPVVSGFATAMSGYESRAAMAGAVAGRALGMGFTAAAGGIIGTAGYTLFKGFERYEAIDAARNRLENLNKVLETTGKTGIDVQAVLKTVNDVVQGTPFSLPSAFSIATRALSSPTGDLKRFMTDVADLAGFMGESMDDVGEAMLFIANQGHVAQRQLHNQLRKMPQAWLAETLHISGDELIKRVRHNQVGLKDLMQTIEEHTHPPGTEGFAKSAGKTVKGAISNVKNAIGRAGSNVLGSIFGSPEDGGNRLVEMLNSIQGKLDEVGKWVTAHKAEIHDFFKTAGEIAGGVVKVLGDILTFLGRHPDAIYAVVIAFGAWKAIEGVAALVTALSTVNTMLGVTIPASVARAATAMSAALAAVAIPAALAAVIAFFTGPGARTDNPTGPRAELEAKGEALEAWSRANPGKATGKDLGDRYGEWLRGRGPMPPEFKDYYREPAKTGPPGDWQSAPGGKKFKWDLSKGGWVPVDGSGGPAPAGSDIMDPHGGGDGKKPHLPKAPVVPYEMGLPPGFDNLPMSSSLYGAESSFLDSRHKLAEKRARLAQLEHDGVATEQDVLDARNDVVKAQRDFQSSEMRLNEARTEIFDKQRKQFRSWISELGDIGAGLDKDFGISKGLAGVAENITKFIASLAAAPILGKLAASQMVAGYKPGEAGQGVMGMLAMQGMFGPQYQIPGSITEEMRKQASAGAAAAAAGGAGAPGGTNWGKIAQAESGGNWHINTGNGYFGGLQFDQATWNQFGGQGFAPRPDLASMEDQIAVANRVPMSERAGRWPNTYSQGAGPTFANAGMGGGAGMSPRDFAHNVMMPFWQQRGIQAGDHEADQYGEHQNGALDLMVPDIQTGQQVLQQVLSDPNVYGAIFNHNSYGYGHGSAPQPYTGPNPHTDHVHAWYKPGNAGNIPVPGMGGMGMPGLDGIIPGGGGGYGVQSAGFGSGGGVGSGLGGGGGASDVHGWGGAPGPGLPGLPGTSNPTRIGGVAQPQNKGSGLSPGGLPMAAAMAGIGAMTGGAGAAAAQSMMQLINRSIQFGGQLAGIGVQGLGETFLPAGSNLAANSWFTKITGALAGASPMLPNIAGKGEDNGPTPESVVGQGQGLDGRPAGVGDMGMKNVDNSDNSKNVNVTNNNTFNAANMNENSMAQTVAYHANAAYT